MSSNDRRRESSADASSVSLPGFASLLLFLTSAAFAVRAVSLLRSGLRWAKINQWDSNGYVQLAAGLRHGCGLARYVAGSCSAPEIIRTPGYPVFLWALHSPKVAILLQAILGACLCWLVGWFTGRRWGAAAGLLAAMLIAVDVPSIVWTTQLMCEPVLEFIVVAAVVCILIGANWLPGNRGALLLCIASILLAAGVLTKPVLLPCLLLIPVPIVLKRNLSIARRAADVALLLVLPLVALSAWTIRNYVTTGIPVFSGVATKNLLYYRAPVVLSMVEGKSISDERAKLVAQLPNPSGFSLQSEGPVHVQSRQALSRMRTTALKIIEQHPFVFAENTLQCLIYLALTPGAEDASLWLSGKGSYAQGELSTADKLRNLRRVPAAATVVALGELILLFVWAGVLLGLIKSLRSRDTDIIWIASLAFLLLLSAAGPEGAARLRVPAMPLLAMIAGAAWATIGGRAGSKRSFG